jgi:hypothetical protein
VPWAAAEILAVFSTWRAASDWLEAYNEARPPHHQERRVVAEWFIDAAKWPTPPPEDDPTNPHPNDGRVNFGQRTIEIGEALDVFGMDDYGRREL